MFPGEYRDASPEIINGRDQMKLLEKEGNRPKTGN